MTTAVRPAPLVVVVAYHSDEHLPGCLAEIDLADNVVVVDNSPSERTRRLADEAGARYVSAGGNVGFAAGVNVGLDAAWDGARDVLLLNPDARITAADVGTMQTALHGSRERRAAVGPQLRSFDGAPQRALWPMLSPAHVWLDAVGLSRLWRGREFVVGAALLLNGSALAELGRLDERYFLYAEEVDWQLRAQRAGWTVGIVDEVTARHAGAASSSDGSMRNALFHASGEKFARRWYGTLGWQVLRLGALVAAARRSVVGSADSRRMNRQTFRLYLRGPVASAPAVGGTP